MVMTAFTVRRAASGDWSDFYAFQSPLDKPLDSIEAAQNRFHRKINSPLHGMFVAELDGRVVGIAMVHEWDEYLVSGRKQMRFSTLEVLPELRRLGIGRALFQAVEGWAVDNGATWLEWYGSQNALPFYERLGHSGQAHSHPNHPYFEIEFKR